MQSKHGKSAAPSSVQGREVRHRASLPSPLLNEPPATQTAPAATHLGGKSSQEATGTCCSLRACTAAASIPDCTDRTAGLPSTRTRVRGGSGEVLRCSFISVFSCSFCMLHGAASPDCSQGEGEGPCSSGHERGVRRHWIRSRGNSRLCY